MDEKNTLLCSKSFELPDVAALGRLYQRAIASDNKTTALAAEQAVLKLSAGEAAIAEARTLAAFLDQV